MNFFKKYSIIIYFIVLLSSVYTLSPLKSVETIVNYSLIGLGLILGLIFSKSLFSNFSYKYFNILWIYLLVNIFYQISFGWLDFKIEDVFYVFAKASIIFILIIAILNNSWFYMNKFFIHISILITVLMVFGGIFGENDLSGRMSFGFSNSNEAGALAALAFGVFLLHPEIKKPIKLIGMIILIFVIFLTGSRSAFIIFLLSNIFKFSFKLKYLISLAFGVIFIFLLIPKFGIELVALDRFFEAAESDDGVFLSNRKNEFEIGFLMFKNKFWEGYGLTGYKIIDPSVVPFYIDKALGTHNGYIAAAKMYGVLFLFLFFISIVIRPIILVFSNFKLKNNYIKIHLFIITAVLVAAFAEDYIVGINSLPTFLFFFSVASTEFYLKFLSKKAVI